MDHNYIRTIGTSLRHPNIIRPIKLTTTIPEDLRLKLDLYLFSDVEGRIPKGAYQDFICARIREFFSLKTNGANDGDGNPPRSSE